MELDQDESENKPELIKETEKLFFALQHNITREAQNTIWGFLTLIKERYPFSKHKREWNILLGNLQILISEFVNDLSSNSEIKLIGLHRNAQELKVKEDKYTGSQFPQV